MATAPEEFENAICDDIRSFAMGFPDSTEGTSCVNRAFKAGGKNFVFLGEKGAQCIMRLKLGDSVDELTERSATDDRIQVGKGGWAKLDFAADNPPTQADLEQWITESFLLLAPKKVAAKLTED